MNVAVISSRFPHGEGEPYLDAELRILQRCLGRVWVAPLRAGDGCRASSGWMHVGERGFDDVIDALRAFIRAPRRALRALRTIATAPVRLQTRVKNVLVFPRALALAERFWREGIDHVHAYWLSTPATAAYVISHVNEHPWSATAHRWDIFENNMVSVKVASAAFVRTVSDRGRQDVLRFANGADGNICVVRLGTALGGSPARMPQEGDRIAILCAAALVTVKGHADLLTAFAGARERDRRLELVLAGDGPLRKRLQRQAARLGISSAVTFRGTVDHLRLLDELRAGRYSAVALASRDDGCSQMEGVPSILIEAMSLGVPCVATLSGAVRELLDATCGFPVAPGSRDELTAALLQIARDPGVVRERARTGVQRARALHGSDRTAAAFAHLFDAQLLQRKISA